MNRLQSPFHDGAGWRAAVLSVALGLSLIGAPVQAVTPAGWKDILYRVKDEISQDRIGTIAAGTTFFILLALFPALAALVSLYGLIADPVTIGEHLASMRGYIPQSMIDLIGGELQRLIGNRSSALSVGFAIGLLLALSEGLKHRQIFMPRDLVTMAAGEDEGDVIPTGERKRPFLAAIDGAAAREAEDFDEADEDELAAQAGRPSNETYDDDPEDDAD